MSLNHPEDEQLDAEGFVRQCRRESRKFPRPHIEEVVRGRVTRVVSRDFISGAADNDVFFSPFDPAMPAFLRRQAD